MTSSLPPPPRPGAWSWPTPPDWFDAGHGSLAVEQQIEHQELMLRFAYRTLGI